MNRIAVAIATWTRKSIAEDLEGIQQGVPFSRTVFMSRATPGREVLTKSEATSWLKMGRLRRMSLFGILPRPTLKVVKELRRKRCF